MKSFKAVLAFAVVLTWSGLATAAETTAATDSGVAVEGSMSEQQEQQGTIDTSAETQGPAADNQGISAASTDAPMNPTASTTGSGMTVDPNAASTTGVATGTSPQASPTASADTASDPMTLAELTGTVLRVDQAQRVLEVRGDNGQTVSLVASASSAADLTDLSVNDRVQVRYDENTRTATEINSL
jgi:hypothetical protein